MHILPLPDGPEGVVKYQLNFASASPGNPADIAELNAWRGLLYRLGLTGRDPLRYGGLAYGNVSLRQERTVFLISGTQTGHLPELGTEHYCRVTAFDPAKNYLVAEGPIQPSSEALTHAAVYETEDRVNCVLHVHSPEIWNLAEHLSLPVTRRQVSYGTPAMAEEVQRLLRISGSRLIAMGGHQDGLIAVGNTVREAALPLIEHLAEAFRLNWEQKMLRPAP
jgi:ribulose-5-phosphate 4-epimerase/fuculose-1-phosphate aldolase